MTRFIEWTVQDIEKMKMAFLEGKKIKIIAKQLGRSPTALNKALSRFGIRESKRNVKSYDIHPCWSNYLIPKGFNQSPHYQPILLKNHRSKTIASSRSLPTEPLPKDQFLIKREHLRSTNPIWVSITKVLRYLERQGYLIIKGSLKDTYLLEDKTLSTSQLVVLANHLRIEEKKPIFLVDEVTW